MVNDPAVRVECIKLRLKRGTIVFFHMNLCLFQINSLHFVSNMSTFLIPTPPSTETGEPKLRGGAFAGVDTI
ncbi:Hypothetical predicted protein [Prunus dulcis]|uniref:Uncharacterized protein n=1 Tax=Prunus dulcis TaxID=3755 RepID=A0A5E4EHZ4_PRUDU|nr:Hypothetical predicted protein [Prunus dulcis]